MKKAQPIVLHKKRKRNLKKTASRLKLSRKLTISSKVKILKLGRMLPDSTSFPLLRKFTNRKSKLNLQTKKETTHVHRARGIPEARNIPLVALTKHIAERRKYTSKRNLLQKLLNTSKNNFNISLSNSKWWFRKNRNNLKIIESQRFILILQCNISK